MLKCSLFGNRFLVLKLSCFRLKKSIRDCFKRKWNYNMIWSNSKLTFKIPEVKRIFRLLQSFISIFEKTDLWYLLWFACFLFLTNYTNENKTKIKYPDKELLIALKVLVLSAIISELMSVLKKSETWRVSAIIKTNLFLLN